MPAKGGIGMNWKAYRHRMVFTRGGAYLRSGRWQRAASAFRRAIELNPADAWSYNHLGIALLKLGQWEEALGVCQRAISLDPGLFDSHMNFGIALLKLARWDEAAAAYDRAIRLNPDSGALHEKRGLALMWLARPDQAVAAYQRSIELDGDPSAYRPLGVLLVRLKRWQEAASAYRRVIALDPTDWEAYAGFATALANLEASPSTVAALQEEVALAPQEAAAHLALGIELLKLERWEEAVSILRRGSAQAPGSATFHFLLVSPLIRLGRVPEAAAAYRRVIELPGVMPYLPAEDAATRFERRRASFWAPENLGARVFQIERWLQELASGPVPPPQAIEPRPAAASARDCRMLFVLDNDYGELTTLMYFALGQPFLDRITILLPDRLSADNANALPGRTHSYKSLDDVLRAVEQERPDIVFLCSGYLFPIHGIFSLEELEGLVRLLRERGCRVVTSDPFLGMLSRRNPRTLISIDIPGNDRASLRYQPEDVERLRQIKTVEDERLRTHFSRCEEILRDCRHLYPAFCDVPEKQATAIESRNLSFFNPSLLCPALASSEGEPASLDAARPPHWLFILSRTDMETQVMFETGAGFADIVARKLMETLWAERHAILVGPGELAELLVNRMPTTERIDLEPYCPFDRLMSLLLSAEYAFYWNVLSHTILIRLFNKLPVVVFDRGHLVRNVPAIYDRVIDWYYQGWEPPLLDHRQTLTLDRLSAYAAPYRREADRMCDRFRRAPTPEQLIGNALVVA
jgi:tetratricopeptide (TPR) repeat protein